MCREYAAESGTCCDAARCASLLPRPTRVTIAGGLMSRVGNTDAAVQRARADPLTTVAGANRFAMGEKIRLTSTSAAGRPYEQDMPTKSTRTIHLTRRESQIMEILHRRQRAAIEDIRAE